MSMSGSGVDPGAISNYTTCVDGVLYFANSTGSSLGIVAPPKTSSDVSSFLSGLVLNGAIAIVALTLFCCLRKRVRYVFGTRGEGMGVPGLWPGTRGREQRGVVLGCQALL